MRPSHSRYSERSFIIVGVMTLVVIVYVARLFYVQVLSPEYKLAAENIAFYHRTLYPSRGLMRDRNDSLVVYNTERQMPRSLCDRWRTSIVLPFAISWT